MTHHKYISIIAFSGLVSWVAWILVVLKLTPNESTGLSLTFFFVTLLIALSTTFAALGFYFRVWLFKNEIFYKHINIALRQGVFLGLIVVFALLFKWMQVFTWWSGFLLVAIAVLLEFYFSSRDSEIA